MEGLDVATSVVTPAAFCVAAKPARELVAVVDRELVRRSTKVFV
jgi:hypothetical protein